MKKKKKKNEWSKVLTSLIIVTFGAYGVWCGIEYYNLSRLAIINNATPPDAILAVTCVTTVLASLLSYCLYQGFLKNSRNKYGLTEDKDTGLIKSIVTGDMGGVIDSLVNDNDDVEENSDLTFDLDENTEEGEV